MEKIETKSTAVATVNGQSIIIIENGEKRIAIKPICQALGVAFQTQIERLKNDPLLSSVVTLGVTTGSDGKQYEMQTIPFKFVFGWLFRIDSRNVKEEARKAVEKYQLECYNALYEHFIELDEYLAYRNQLTEEAFLKVEAAREDFRNVKSRLDTLKEEFKDARALTLDIYREQKRQLALDFEAVPEGGDI
jgi:hypothetical protein